MMDKIEAASELIVTTAGIAACFAAFYGVFAILQALASLPPI